MLSLECLDGSIVLVSVVSHQADPAGGVEAAVEVGTGQQVTPAQIIVSLVIDF